MRDPAAIALVDCLLPGDADYPPASDVGLDTALAVHDRFGPPLRRVLAMLPHDFAAGDGPARDAGLRVAEASEPAWFSALVVGAYSLYYTHPVVADVLARLTGYAAGAPQPEGHDLAPFDPAMVAVPAARAPHFRTAPETFDENR